MAEERSFLDRWSVRKRAARDAEAKAKAQHPAEAPAADPGQQPATAAPAELPEIDPADLPPLDSIKTGVDVQEFLQRGVPKALRQAALRRLWAADPAIREFREMADYDWDFNAPGYGALLPGDDPKAAAGRVLEAMRRQMATVREVPRPAERPVAADEATSPERAAHLPPSPTPVDNAAVEPAAPAPQGATEATSRAPRRRRHGGAVPG
jgi:hypothetical protein